MPFGNRLYRPVGCTPSGKEHVAGRCAGRQHEARAAFGPASAAGGSAKEKYGGRMSRALKVAANAVIGGGKFANGAITGGFSILFNDLMHQKPSESILKNGY